ncbi:hypothetical protein CAL7716_075860 [Calothrix sp. PCC 7716]|nr:hypothetical protein CAL7716_075860 [Calothrix sp. PCC 7716]
MLSKKVLTGNSATRRAGTSITGVSANIGGNSGEVDIETPASWLSKDAINPSLPINLSRCNTLIKSIVKIVFINEINWRGAC